MASTAALMNAPAARCALAPRAGAARRVRAHAARALVASRTPLLPLLPRRRAAAPVRTVTNASQGGQLPEDDDEEAPQQKPPLANVMSLIANGARRQSSLWRARAGARVVARALWLTAHRFTCRHAAAQTRCSPCSTRWPPRRAECTRAI
jgi:hypothetical protein